MNGKFLRKPTTKLMGGGGVVYFGKEAAISTNKVFKTISDGLITKVRVCF